MSRPPIQFAVSRDVPMDLSSDEVLALVDVSIRCFARCPYGRDARRGHRLGAVSIRCFARCPYGLPAAELHPPYHAFQFAVSRDVPMDPEPRIVTTPRDDPRVSIRCFARCPYGPPRSSRGASGSRFQFAVSRDVPMDRHHSRRGDRTDHGFNSLFREMSLWTDAISYAERHGESLFQFAVSRDVPMDHRCDRRVDDRAPVFQFAVSRDVPMDDPAGGLVHWSGFNSLFREMSLWTLPSGHAL